MVGAGVHAEALNIQDARFPFVEMQSTSFEKAKRRPTTVETLHVSFCKQSEQIDLFPSSCTVHTHIYIYVYIYMNNIIYSYTYTCILYIHM